MAGIYFHIPFCRKACHYCNFHFSTNLSYVERMIDAMLIETNNASGTLKAERIESIYFGGGTPSVLSAEQIGGFVGLVYELYDVDAEVEITLEANPEDISEEYCKELVAVGINRVSIGIQSFFDRDLTFMNRAHDSGQAEEAIKTIQASGIESLCVDLMFGLVDSDMDQWKKNLQRLISFNPQHISCYNLTIEEQTAFHKWEEQGKIQSLKDNIQFDQFILAHELLSANGYDHYEISNFCKPGLRSRHNTNYWSHGSYMGIGPGAHSYTNRVRHWNCSNNMKYIQQIEIDQVIQERETLTEVNLYNEMIMLGLRQSKGVDKSKVKKFSSEIQTHFAKTTAELRGKNLLIVDHEAVKLSIENWYLSDHISAQMFYD